MKMRSVFTVLFVGLLLADVHAQAAASTVAWDHAASDPSTAPALLAEVQTYTFTLKVGALPAVTLTPTCVVNGSGVSCSAPVVLPPLILTVKTTFVLTASNAFGSASTTLTGQSPANPKGLKIITIVIGG